MLTQLLSSGVYPPAEDYVNHVDKSRLTLVEAFRNMQIEEEETLENGDFDHEVTFRFSGSIY